MDKNQLKESGSFIRSRTKAKPKVAIVLGSGLGDFADSLSNKIAIDTSSIPHYPVSTVEGHKGKLVFGRIGKTELLAFQGRVHFYETGTLNTILFPIQVARALGVKTLIVTNAAGGVNKQFNPGDLMLITDQINLTFESPLRGKTPSKQIRSSFLYDVLLQEIIYKTALQHSLPLQRGVYCGVKGPSYETAAEIEMIRRIGADAVGMSTVNEVSLAHALGMKIAGISCITNYATGIKDLKLSHAEVTETANLAKKKFTLLLKSIIPLF
ncbi:MAG: purine-nucleoside phosphorylase [Ignavibacteriae bacterium]|nr:purine-nucleoside phosphorylase [Ignavibacteriota bacterium]